MSKTLRIILAIVTLLTTLGCVGLTIFAFTIPHYGMAACCAALAAMFSLFVIHDYGYFFGTKTI